MFSSLLFAVALCEAQEEILEKQILSELHPNGWYSGSSFVNATPAPAWHDKSSNGNDIVNASFGSFPVLDGTTTLASQQGHFRRTKHCCLWHTFFNPLRFSHVFSCAVFQVVDHRPRRRRVATQQRSPVVHVLLLAAPLQRRQSGANAVLVSPIVGRNHAGDRVLFVSLPSVGRRRVRQVSAFGAARTWYELAALLVSIARRRRLVPSHQRVNDSEHVHRGLLQVVPQRHVALEHRRRR
jgi:hypothetical protein